MLSGFPVDILFYLVRVTNQGDEESTWALVYDLCSLFLCHFSYLIIYSNMGREEIELAQEIPLISTVTPLATVTIDLSDDLEQQQSKDILKRDPFFKPYTFGKFQIIHELQSERVKAVAFHPSPSHSHLLLVSFFTGIIALWDLNDHCIIDTFTGHMDAVRAIAFHPFLLLFASGGNDFHVGVWKYRLSSTPEERDRLDYMFLKGHNDFVRSVQFHPTGTLPWVISGSDDMTIRIWNHQSQMCLSVIFGHLHYVMSVCFHITYQQDELLVSGSLDQTVRVWDFKDLRQRAVGPMDESEGPPKYLHSPILDEPNLRGCFNRWKADRGVVVKYCLEGHSRGVNTVAVHPKYPEVIGSGGDDHKIRIWRMNRNNTVNYSRTHTLTIVTNMVILSLGT